MDRRLEHRPYVLDEDEIEYGEAPLNPRVVDLKPLDDYRLKLRFTNGEVRIFDVKPYLNLGVIAKLRDREIFEEAWVEAGSVEWPCGVGFSYDTLYLESIPAPTLAAGEK